VGAFFVWRGGGGGGGGGGVGWGDESRVVCCFVFFVVWKMELDLTLLMTLDDTIPNSL